MAESEARRSTGRSARPGGRPPRCRSGATRSSRATFAAGSPTSISWSRTPAGSSSSASAATTRRTASCARTRSPRAAPPHAAGVAPRVAYAEPGVLVLDFIEGRTFDAGGRARPEEPRAHRRARAPHAPRDAEASARAGRALLGLPRRARLRAHALRAAEHRHGASAPADRRSRSSWSAPSGRSSSSSATTTCCRQHHRRRQAAVAGRLGICRLQLAALRSRRPRLEQRDAAEDARDDARALFRRRSPTSCAAASPR